MSILAVCQIVFIILKLTGNIDWSWWGVFSPLWIDLFIALCVIIKDKIDWWIL